MDSITKSEAQKIGFHFESIAEEYLHKKGLKTVTKNFQCRTGEIDLIMLEKNTLVFIEVRFRQDTRYGHPLETITRAKQKKIIRAAQTYLKLTKDSDSSCRFDAIGIHLNSKNQHSIDWVPGAFY